MKGNLLITTLLLLLLASQVYAAERSLSIEYQYYPPADKTVTGFILYQNDVQVCTTNVVLTPEFTCSFEAEPGLYNYTMKAVYADGSTSPKSPSYPFTITELTTGYGILVPVFIRLIVVGFDK